MISWVMLMKWILKMEVSASSPHSLSIPLSHWWASAASPQMPSSTLPYLRGFFFFFFSLLGRGVEAKEARASWDIYLGEQLASSSNQLPLACLLWQAFVVAMATCLIKLMFSDWQLLLTGLYISCLVSLRELLHCFLHLCLLVHWALGSNGNNCCGLSAVYHACRNPGIW